MRLFVAVEIEPQLAAAATALIDELRARASRLAPGARMTWVTPERLHLTLAFIGNADAARSQAICGVLSPTVGVPPFRLTVAGVGSFPKTGQPRVIWAGLTAGRDRLQEVERVVSSRLATAGIPPEPRAFNPHLTLARVREAAGLRAGPLFEGLEDDVIGATGVEAITLFDSRLSSKGPTYVPLLRAPLAPAGA